MSKPLNKVIVYIYALFLLLCNGSVFWGVKFGNPISLGFFAISILLAISSGKIKVQKQNAKTMLMLVALLLVSNIVNIKNGVNWVSLLLLFGQLITIYIFQSRIEMHELHKAIINCMLFICIISLVTFILYEYNNQIFQWFIIRERIHNSSYIYIYTLWQTFGWNVNFHRNAGPYWEAGLFACFIAFTASLLIFSFNEEEFGGKIKYYSYLYIFMATLLSTLSSTGYLAMIFILVFNLLKNKETSRRKIILKVLIGLLTILVVYALYTSEVIQNKLYTTNSSLTKRIDDITGGWELIKINPLFGLGFRSDVSRQYEAYYGFYNSANGLVQGMYRIGGIAFIYMLYVMWRSMTRVMEKKNGTFLFIITLFLFFCEPIELFIIFLSNLFPFYYTESKT